MPRALSGDAGSDGIEDIMMFGMVWAMALRNSGCDCAALVGPLGAYGANYFSKRSQLRTLTWTPELDQIHDDCLHLQARSRESESY